MLDIEALPANGAGKLKGEKMEVVYKYKPIAENDESICKVNAIYMNDEGKVIETKTITGVEGEEYSLIENEYENMKLIEVPDNCYGTYVKGEINVLFNYVSDPDPYKDMLVYVYIGAGLILALCAVSAVYGRISRKRKFMAEMDIEED